MGSRTFRKIAKLCDCVEASSFGGLAVEARRHAHDLFRDTFEGPFLTLRTARYSARTSNLIPDDGSCIKQHGLRDRQIWC